MFTSAWSPGVPGLPTTTASFTKPSEAAAWPFASGVPTVSAADCWTGGWQERDDSGGPWFRLKLTHCLYAGTSEALIGEAPLGRTWSVDGQRLPIWIQLPAGTFREATPG